MGARRWGEYELGEGKRAQIEQVENRFLSLRNRGSIPDHVYARKVSMPSHDTRSWGRCVYVKVLSEHAGIEIKSVGLGQWARALANAALQYYDQARGADL